MSTGPTAKTVRLVKDRAANRCERCGHSVEDVRAAVHHRRPRGMGGTSRPGTNSPSNLLLLCDPCHLSVESSRQISRERGWLVRQEHDPARQPVWLAGRENCRWATYTTQARNRRPPSLQPQDAANGRFVSRGVPPKRSRKKAA